MSFEDVDHRRMEFQRYLEKSSVVETITRVLAALYEAPEKPLDSNEFIRDFLSVSAPDDVEQLRSTLTGYQTKITQLDADIEEGKKENEFLQRKLDQVEGRTPSLNPNEPKLTTSTQQKQNDEAVAAAHFKVE